MGIHRFGTLIRIVEFANGTWFLIRSDGDTVSISSENMHSVIRPETVEEIVALATQQKGTMYGWYED